MKTVQNLIDEEHERQNPKYSDILIKRDSGGLERFSNPANIIQGEWLEFDTTTNYNPTTTHVKTRGTIVEYVEKRM